MPSQQPLFLGGSALPARCAPQHDASWVLRAAAGGGDGAGGRGGGGSGGSGGDGGESDDGDELLSLSQAEELAAARGASLPEDMASVALSGGLRRSVLEAYLAILGGGGFLSSLLARMLPAFRDRLIADKMFLFKVLAEVAIDSGCATVAEVRKRGKDFWGEFEFYLSDLVVGLVLDVVLVSLMAPVAVLGARPKAATASGLHGWLGRLPAQMFEASSPARKYRGVDRLACWFVKFFEYSLAGIVCGFIGQGAANGMMALKRKHMGPSEHDVPIPPVVETALVWGLFMGVSSNTRYQVVAGLERLVDLTIARKIPAAAYFATLALRFYNNVVGGENFIDMARYFGVQ